MASRNHTAAGLAAGAAAASVILTAAAFWLSFEHLHDVDVANGLRSSAARAWAWPGTVDLFIIIGELLVLRSLLLGRVDPWAVTLTTVGTLGSIALNVAGVGFHAGPLEQTVAAVPPVAAFLAFGVVMRQIHEHVTRDVPHDETPPVSVYRTPETPIETASHAAPTPPVPPATQPPPVLITTREAMEHWGVSRATLNRWMSNGRLTPVLKDPIRGNLFDPTNTP